MCERLAALRAAMAGCAASFDASVLSAADARLARDHAAAIEAMAATVKALAAARVAEGGRWKRDGQRSAAHELAAATGTTVAEARDTLELGRRLVSQPEVSEAARRGELSAAQSRVIADAAGADPSSAGRLLARAQDGSLAELRDEAARAKAAAHPDLEARRKSIHARRGLRDWIDPEGTWHLAASGNPEDGAEIMAAIRPLADRIFQQARRDGRREPPAAYGFDALVELARSAAPDGRARPAPLKLLVRVDLEALLRGYPADGETCELAGYGPVAVSAIRDLMASRSTFLAAIVTRLKALVGVAHLGRRPTAHQQSALEWLYPSCAAEGCAAQGHLERDHRVDWARSHLTVLDLLDLLCPHHHRLKTTEGWALVPGTGKRPFVPPDDRRHPRHPGVSSGSGRAETRPPAPACPPDVEALASTAARDRPTSDLPGRREGRTMHPR